MGIHKKIKRRNDQLTHDAAVPTFSMQPDPALAQVIVDAWLNTDYDWTKPDGTIERVIPVRKLLASPHRRLDKP